MKLLICPFLQAKSDLRLIESKLGELNVQFVGAKQVLDFQFYFMHLSDFRKNFSDAVVVHHCLRKLNSTHVVRFFENKSSKCRDIYQRR